MDTTYDVDVPWQKKPRKIGWQKVKRKYL